VIGFTRVLLRRRRRSVRAPVTSAPSTFDFLKSFDVLMIVVLGGWEPDGNAGRLLRLGLPAGGMRVALPPDYIEFRWVSSTVLLIVTIAGPAPWAVRVREFPFLRSKVYLILEVQGLTGTSGDQGPDGSISASGGRARGTRPTFRKTNVT